ncbi:MAG: hypothetical protein ACREAB_10205 [Blastocatellia bacterium]
MESKTVDRQKLTAYLLGALPETEQEAIAEQYFTNDELFEMLLEVESDLIRQYVRGDLPAEDRPRLESYLQVLPDGREKVAFAQISAQISPEDRAAAEAMLFEAPAADQRSAQTTGLRQPLVAIVAWLAQPVPALVMVTGLLVLGGVIWMFLYNRMSQEKEQLLAQMRQRNAQQTQSLREAERKLAEEQTRGAQLQRELEREKLLRKTQPTVQSPALSLPMISWLLSSTAIRDPGQPSETVRLDPNAKTVALVIPAKGRRKYTGYEVQLRTEDGGRILWKDSQPDTPPLRSGQNIVFYRPAKEFDEASYKLTLTLISDQETQTRDYYFTVTSG